MSANCSLNDGLFCFDEKNNLKCGSIKIRDIIDHLNGNNKAFTTKNFTTDAQQIQTPFFLYSKKRILHNIRNYISSFDEEITKKFGVQTFVSYSLKANFNPNVLKIFYENNSWCSLVNENELRLALKVGFNGERLIFNGNGKTRAEIKSAIQANCFLNIDSKFNLNHTIEVASKLKSKNELLSPVKMIIRLNPSIDAQVHPYLNTSIKTSKFGVNMNQFDELIELISANKDLVKLVGFHCHLGSTITATDSYEECVKFLVDLVKQTREKVDTIEYLNLGGGLGINYQKFANRTAVEQKDFNEYPKPRDLAISLAKYLNGLENIKIIVEPGRSLIADAVILVSNLIGYKENGSRNFLVVDASMCECIRPSLYSAYHHVEFIDGLNLSEGEKKVFDVVGPVCESGDFLAKDRYLSMVQNEDNVYLAVFDVGAYCAAMASNYNMHLRAAEIMIDEDGNESSPQLVLIRHQDNFEDLIKPFEF